MNLNFDARQVDFEERGTYEPLPLDWYNVQVEREEEKPKDDGKFQLILWLKVLRASDPQNNSFIGREKMWNFNIQNPDQTTVRIAFETLSKLSYVVGIPGWNNSKQLHGKPFWAKIGPQKKNPDYDDVLEMKNLAGESPTECKKRFFAGMATPGGLITNEARLQVPQTPQPAFGAPAAASQLSQVGTAPNASPSSFPAFPFAGPVHPAGNAYGTTFPTQPNPPQPQQSVFPAAPVSNNPPWKP